jgi:Rrf2 family iron-sulfur cluster assembly transcriptional regulator
MLLLARERAAGHFLRADEIAEAIGAPRNYTSKVLSALAKAEMIVSSRGPSGGFRLSKAAHTISVGNVVDLFFTPSGNPRCLNGNAPCNPRRPCTAHERWASVIAAQRAPLDATTIADLVDTRLAPLVRSRPATWVDQ